ncbi:MAG: hypothetical protein JNM26_15510 [Ideonella sp.]|nr:hypothetical protein [Ideonella sp.]
MDAPQPHLSLDNLTALNRRETLAQEELASLVFAKPSAWDVPAAGPRH